jgi:hypothetical protein
MPLCVRREITEKSRILILQEKWYNMVVANKNIYEIRPQQCRHLLNERIFLSKSESKAVSASAIFADTIGPLDESSCERLRSEHSCVPGPRRYGDRTLSRACV